VLNVLSGHVELFDALPVVIPPTYCVVCHTYNLGSPALLATHSSSTLAKMLAPLVYNSTSMAPPMAPGRSIRSHQ
jgi:hypothetical protein